ncbi:HAMP domain-containing protein [Celerinatantimonas sp. MCCC 1A17872]|uniref:PDC sensor domain-containing protein n=1 Tax=Celerinatantimonas sp. MCCC 1A17872 TaxID=3177514 RepID=UPI0038C05E1F
MSHQLPVRLFQPYEDLRGHKIAIIYLNQNNTMGNNPQTGRFTPYWTRDHQGHIGVQSLVDYDSTERLSNGVMKGGWYIKPKQNHTPSVTAPLPYIVQGKHVWLATFSSPILVNDKFLGVVGADYNLQFVQSLSKQVASHLYNGRAEVSILTDQGLVIADSDRPETIGKSMSNLFNKQYQKIFNAVKSGQVVIFNNKEHENIGIISPITLGKTNSLWAIVIRVKRNIALENVINLDQQIKVTNHSNMVWQTTIGLLISILGLIAIIVMANSLSKPILRAVKMAKTLALGDFNTRLNYKSSDEIGQLSNVLDNMADNLHWHVRVAEEIAKGNLNQSVQIASDKDQLGKALCDIL